MAGAPRPPPSPPPSLPPSPGPSVPASLPPSLYSPRTSKDGHHCRRRRPAHGQPPTASQPTGTRPQSTAHVVGVCRRCRALVATTAPLTPPNRRWDSTTHTRPGRGGEAGCRGAPAAVATAAAVAVAASPSLPPPPSAPLASAAAPPPAVLRRWGKAGSRSPGNGKGSLGGRGWGAGARPGGCGWRGGARGEWRRGWVDVEGGGGGIARAWRPSASQTGTGRVVCSGWGRPPSPLPPACRPRQGGRGRLARRRPRAAARHRGRKRGWGGGGSGEGGGKDDPLAVPSVGRVLVGGEGGVGREGRMPPPPLPDTRT